MSISTRVKITGLKSLQAKLEQLGPEARTEISQALYVAAFRIQRNAKISIQKSPADPTTGRSIPGNPPKTDTGRLVNSIYVKTKEDSETKTELLVGTDVTYGRDLEFGTKNVAARPWLYPATQDAKRENKESLKKVVTDVLRKVARMKFGGVG
jgi:HK97 gp10 family phage protein